MLYCIIVEEANDVEEANNDDNNEEEEDNTTMPPKEKLPPAKKTTTSAAGKPSEPSTAPRPPPKAEFFGLNCSSQDAITAVYKDNATQSYKVDLVLYVGVWLEQEEHPDYKFLSLSSSSTFPSSSIYSNLVRLIPHPAPPPPSFPLSPYHCLHPPPP